jgi:hypothetical protein
MSPDIALLMNWVTLVLLTVLDNQLSFLAVLVTVLCEDLPECA